MQQNENVICKMAAILPRPQCANTSILPIPVCWKEIKSKWSFALNVQMTLFVWQICIFLSYQIWFKNDTKICINTRRGAFHTTIALGNLLCLNPYRDIYLSLRWAINIKSLLGTIEKILHRHYTLAVESRNYDKINFVYGKLLVRCLVNVSCQHQYLSKDI